MIKSFTGLIHSKYLGIHLDKYLTWKHQINVAINLHKANAILSKIRPYIDMKTFYTIYYGIFEITFILCFIGLGAKFIIC